MLHLHDRPSARARVAPILDRCNCISCQRAVEQLSKPIEIIDPGWAAELQEIYKEKRASWLEHIGAPTLKLRGPSSIRNARPVEPTDVLE